MHENNSIMETQRIGSEIIQLVGFNNNQTLIISETNSQVQCKNL